MDEEDVMQLSQLLQTMKEIAEKMQAYESKVDSDRSFAAKREILSLQKEINELLK